jgi:drug/metabolite transporter (DMT)-like permease
MRLRDGLGFIVLMAFDTLAQISFKYSALHALPMTADAGWLLRIFSQPWIYGACLGYVGTFFIWITLLRKVSVGPAFAASHLEVVSVMLCSVWLFHETLTLPRVAGAALILAGIFCLARAEMQTHAAQEKSAKGGKEQGSGAQDFLSSQRQ